MPDLSTHIFEINGETVDLYEIGLQPISLENRFGSGASLTLSQNKDHYAGLLQPNDTIAYKSDGVYRFIGKVRGISRQTATDRIVYQADDVLRRASSKSISLVFATNPYQAEATINSVSAVLKAGIADAGETVGDGFDALTGIIAKTRGTFAGTLADLIQQEQSAIAEYRLIANYEGGIESINAVRVYGTGTINILQWGGRADLQTDLVGRVADLDITENIEGCYTAVFLVQPDRKGSTSTYDKEVTLNAAWDGDDQDDWYVVDGSFASATGAVLADDPADSRAMVYRAWRLGSEVQDFDQSQPWRFMVQVPKNNRNSFASAKWVPIEANYVEIPKTTTVNGGEYVIVTRYIIAKHPVTVGGNVRVKGKARGPAAAKLIYQAERGGGNNPTSLRLPSAGYEGSAYTRYGVENLRRVEVSDNRLVTNARAQQILDVLKDVKHNGRIVVYGRMPSWSWDGGSAVQVSGLTERGIPVASEYQAIPFTQTGWSVDFARDLYSIELTDDRAQFVDQDRLS